MYAPLTNEGNIVVDGVLASCYALTDHDHAHIVLLPLRWFPDIMDLIFGEINDHSGYAIMLQNVANFINLPSHK